MRKLILIEKSFLLALLAISCFSTQTYSQTNIVNGSVKDDKGKSLAGVTILIQNKKIGTSTDADGKFTINATSTDKLVFSFTGMKEQIIVVGQKLNVDITMTEDTKMLEEVIAVGYSSKKLTEISSSVVNLNREKLAATTATSMDGVDLLQGKVAGLTIFDNNYDAGTAPSIRIRGTGSITASSEPLWVVDGVISSANAFNPNDVESITVMKDAGATGLYGSKASSGVIVVTTKKGKAGKGLFNISSAYGSNKPMWGNFQGLMNSAELYDYHREAFENDNAYLPSATNTEALWMSSVMRGRTREQVIATDFNWLDLLYPTGASQKHGLSYSGGTEKSTQYISFNYNKIDGTMRGNDEEQISGQMNLSFKFGNKWKLDTRTFVSFRKTNFPLFGENVRFASFDSPYNPDGSLKYLPEIQADWIGTKATNMLIYEQIGNVNNEKALTLLPQFTLTYEISPKLKLSSNTQYRYNSGLTKEYRDGRSWADDQDPFAGYLGITNAFLARTQSTGHNLLNNEILSFDERIGNSNFNGQVGFEYQSQVSDGFSATNTGLVNGISVLSATSGVPIVKGALTEIYRLSYFSQFNYSLANKYFLTASYRRDGSSKFGNANRYGNFYSGSAGWLVSGEKFMKNITKTISNLKLRISHGVTGNDNFSNYSAVETFSLGSNYNFQAGAAPTQYANPNLTWEKAYTSNIGMDLSLWKKIDFTFDFYHTLNKDILYQVPLDPSSGFDLGWKNIGSVQNKGIEFSVSGNIINTKNFKWYSNLSIAYNHNQLVSLTSQSDRGIIDAKLNKILKVGYNLNSSYIFDYVGANPQTGLATWNTVDSTGKVNGTTSWQLNPAIAYKTKNLAPQITGGFNNKISFKGLALEVMVSYAGDFYTMLTSNIWFRNGEKVIQGQSSAILNKRWQKPGDQAYFPRPFFGVYSKTQTAPNKPDGMNLVKGDFLKVNYISFSYDLPKSILEKYKMQNVTFFARLNNPIIKVFDDRFLYTTPEAQGYGGEINVNNKLRPIQQSLVFGTNISF
jgi:TonB-linked SusC/RagA family outer membrane protein